MAISSDPERRRNPPEQVATPNGHINGVPFVDVPRTNAEDQERAFQDVKFMDTPESVKQAEMNVPEWLSISLRNVHVQIRKARHESSLSFAIALAAIALDIIILANHFTH